MPFENSNASTSRRKNKDNSVLHFAAVVLVVSLLCVGTSIFFFTAVSQLVRSPPRTSKTITINTKHAPIHHNRRQRLGVVLPFVGKSAADIPPYLPLFCTGAVGASTVADFLIFHNGVLAEASGFVETCSQASNIKLIDLGSTQAMMELFAGKLLDKVDQGGWAIPRPQFVRFLAQHTALLPYTLVEYKPAYGHIFEDYLADYSHWAYSDMDVVWGDLGRHLTPADWSDFDLVTWGFGDQRRLYLRGQFTMHRNDPTRINQLWRDCAYLSRIDQRFAKLVAEQADFKLESAEGCYSVAVLQYNDVSIKYANVAWTDIDKDDTAYTHGIQLVRDTARQRHILVKRESINVPAPPPDYLSYYRLSTSVLYRDESLPWQEGIGAMEPLVLPHGNHGSDMNDDPCHFFWIQPIYRSQLCLEEALDPLETVFWVKGQLYKQQIRNLVIHEGLLTGPFFHFQEWKRRFQTHQLEAILDPSLTSFLLTQEGGIPIKYNDAGAMFNIRKRQSNHFSSPLRLFPDQWKGDGLVDWQATEDSKEYRNRTFPRQLYCLQHGEPQHFHGVPCRDAVGWTNRERVKILTGASDWKQVNPDDEVTLCLTLQIVLNSAEPSTGRLAGLQILLGSLDSWQGQPAVVVISLEGADNQQQAISTLQDSFQPYARNALVAVVLSELDNGRENKDDNRHDEDALGISRKALLNMAMDMSPTRWYMCGLEVERGLVLSRDTVVLAHRAAGTAVQNGRFFWVPQFATNATTRILIDLESASLTNLMQLREENSVAQPWQLEKPCHDSVEVERNSLLEKLVSRWWLISASLLTEKYASTQMDTLDRAKSIEDLGTSILELLETPSLLLKFNESPILLVDNAGPHAGVRAHSLLREVEAFAGTRCFSALRMALLVATGYRMDVLEGAFALSSEGTRAMLNQRRSSTCDSCPVLQGHSKTSQKIVQEEIKRVINTAIIWEKPLSSTP